MRVDRVDTEKLHYLYTSSRDAMSPCNDGVSTVVAFSQRIASILPCQFSQQQIHPHNIGNYVSFHLVDGLKVEWLLYPHVAFAPLDVTVK